MDEHYKIYIPVRLFTVSGMFTNFFGLSKKLQDVSGQVTTSSSDKFPYPPNLRHSIQSCSIGVCGFLFVKIPAFPLLGDWS
jgi:hypothetical protein